MAEEAQGLHCHCSEGMQASHFFSEQILNIICFSVVQNITACLSPEHCVGREGTLTLTLAIQLTGLFE